MWFALSCCSGSNDSRVWGFGRDMARGWYIIRALSVGGRGELVYAIRVVSGVEIGALNSRVVSETTHVRLQLYLQFNFYKGFR